MQDFTIFDMVIVSITVLLGLKGLLRGFIKEVFGLVGIVGGIFVGSRIALDIGNIIAPILALENNATIKLLGFVLGVIGFWAIIYILGIILSKIFSASGLGLFDRILGFVFGSAKIFLIFSVIAYALYQVTSFKSLMDKKVSNAIVFPILLETGGFIIKLDASDFTRKIEEQFSKEEKTTNNSEITKDKTLTEEVKNTVNEIKKTTTESTKTVVDSLKKTVHENVEKMLDKKIKDKDADLVKEAKEKAE
ncbi:MAG: CvpA family protein [Arcobacter sp.]|nr:CvpA family protein [Arcobacter sp.]